MRHKKQHYIPRTYLEAWCDPHLSPKETPYVWLQTLDGLSERRKSPTKTFTETDFYTIRGVEGSRDLVLEHGLAQLEGRYASVRRNVLDARKPWSVEDRLAICAFVAAMKARTKVHRDHVRQFWKEILDFGHQVQERVKTMSPEQRAQIAALPFPSRSEAEREKGMTLKDIEEVVQHPSVPSVLSSIEVSVPFLMSMPVIIFETESSNFITSDNPCFWFDPEIIRGNSSFQAPALLSPTLEISLPVSPKQALLFTYKDLGRPEVYQTVNDPRLADSINARTRQGAREYTVTNSSVLGA